MRTKHIPAVWLIRLGRFCGSYRPSFPRALVALIAFTSGL